MRFFSLAILGLFLLTNGYASPPTVVPENLRVDYTLNGQIPVAYLYLDGTYSEPLVYSIEEINSYIQKAVRRETSYYGATDLYLYQLLNDLVDEIKGKEVAVIGSTTPWYESILISYGARPVVIEYNSVSTPDSRITYLKPEQYWKNPRKFDFVLSISSIEHDGLGRYGDPIDPNGDLKSMTEMRKMLTPTGKLIIAFPVGPDQLIWNAHRIYGPIRLKMLFSDWTPIKCYGFTNDRFINQPLGNATYQPIFILRPN